MNVSLSDRNDLTVGVVWKKLIVFFLPMAAGTCIQQLYNAVDGMVVGRFVGTEALAAVGGSASMIINVLIGFFVAMTGGASVVIAQIFGAGRKSDVPQASGNAIAISAVIGISLAVLGYIFAPFLLKLMRTPEDTMEYSILYLRIYFAGVPFIMILNMESNMLRAVGDSLHPFIYMLAGCLSNIVLDCIFVIVFGWGVAGVAIATVIAQIINMSLLSKDLLTTNEPYRLSLSNLRLNGRFLPSMMKLGIPCGLQSSMYTVSNTFIQVGINSLGTVAVASWTMTGKVDGIFWAVSSALGIAITSFVGQNFGAGRMDRVKACVKQGFIVSLSITVFLSSAILLLAKPVISILTTDTAVIEMTNYLLYFFVPFYFVWSLVEVFSAVPKGAGDATGPVIIVGISICLFRLIWLFTVFAYFGTIESLSMSYSISWIIAGIALFVYYKKGKWMTKAKDGFMS